MYSLPGNIMISTGLILRVFFFICFKILVPRKMNFLSEC